MGVRHPTVCSNCVQVRIPISFRNLRLHTAHFYSKKIPPTLCRSVGHIFWGRTRAQARVCGCARVQARYAHAYASGSRHATPTYLSYLTPSDVVRWHLRPGRASLRTGIAPHVLLKTEVRAKGPPRSGCSRKRHAGVPLGRDPFARAPVLRSAALASQEPHAAQRLALSDGHGDPS